MHPLLRYTRRDVLRSSSVGLVGMTLPSWLQATSYARTRPASARASSCIVIYCWGGISHYESFDPKPAAPVEVRGEFAPIPTKTPGIQFCEHLPKLAQHSDKLAIIRSVQHRDGAHSGALYANLTGHHPAVGRARDRENWPSLTAMIARLQESTPGLPSAVRLPHSMYDNGTLIAGQFGGWLGPAYDPILLPHSIGRPFAGVSRASGRELELTRHLQASRLSSRRQLLAQLDAAPHRGTPGYDQLDQFQQMAADLLLDSAFSEAYDLEREDSRIRGLYGEHQGGQNLLLARRLVEVGVPVVQVCAGAGDLAGGSGDNWDTHRDHFPKMKQRLLPVFDQSVSALLTDLAQRGMLEDTIVVVLTDFGRTPRINANGGRDHHPAVYSLALAGGGIRGGQVYGASDVSGSQPDEDACSPADVHATVFRALGIDPQSELTDPLGRPFRICEGQALPLF